MANEAWAITVDSGSIPEWSNGVDCKSTGSAFEGSNPSRPTILRFMRKMFTFTAKNVLRSFMRSRTEKLRMVNQKNIKSLSEMVEIFLYNIFFWESSFHTFPFISCSIQWTILLLAAHVLWGAGFNFLMPLLCSKPSLLYWLSSGSSESCHHTPSVDSFTFSWLSQSCFSSYDLSIVKRYSNIKSNFKCRLSR